MYTHYLKKTKYTYTLSLCSNTGKASLLGHFLASTLFTVASNPLMAISYVPVVANLWKADLWSCHVSPLFTKLTLSSTWCGLPEITLDTYTIY